MSRAKLNSLVNKHVNYWFHQERLDGTSPALTLKRCNELFLKKIQRMDLDIFCDERHFRRAMCEALCTMYVSEKEGTNWFGPHSQPPRPRDWSSGKERVWREYRDYQYLNADFWHSFWAEVASEEGIWESSIPTWRISYQNIVSHYVNVMTDKVDDSAVEDVARLDSVIRFDDDEPRRPTAVKSEYESDD